MEKGQISVPERNYRYYFRGRMISGIGDAMQDLAVLTMIAFYTNSVAISGMIVTVNALIRILSSMAAVQIRPRKNVRNVLIGLNCLYGFITFAFYLCYRLNHVMPYHIIVGYEALCSLLYAFYKIYQDMLMKTVCTSNENISRLIAADNLMNVAVSFVGTALLIVCRVDLFLLVNAGSFFISAGFIGGIRAKTEMTSRIPAEKKQNMINRTILFQKTYPTVTGLMLICGGISFFYASYHMVIQAALREFSIDKLYIGIFRGVFYVSSIALSYMAGFLNMEHIKRYLGFCLLTGMVGLGITPCLKGVAFLGVISVIYAVFGGGFYTLCQIFFQNAVQQGDIPSLKGIYNLICGGAILAAGLILPGLLEAGGLLLWGLLMLALLAGCTVYMLGLRIERNPV